MFQRSEYMWWTASIIAALAICVIVAVNVLKVTEQAIDSCDNDEEE